MALKGKVAAKRTIIKGRDKFPAGKQITPEKLGISEKEFRAMGEEGSIVIEQSAPAQPKRQPQTRTRSGESEA